VFNAVEGNTTFYASPAVTTVQRWAETLPEHFRFTAKFPGDISHGGDLREQLTAAETFTQLLSPLGARVSPLWLQLSKSFTPQRLPELAGFIDALERPLAVEVRHDEFFAKGDSERELNRLLLDRGVERICLDPRAVQLHIDGPFGAPRAIEEAAGPTASGGIHAMSAGAFHRPSTAGSQRSVSAALGGENRPVDRRGAHAYIFLHTADNVLAAKLAQRFHARLMLRLPGCRRCLSYTEPAAEQLGLL
jgi:uncharacterized protein YecE (DUF72 family)